MTKKVNMSKLTKQNQTKVKQVKSFRTCIRLSNEAETSLNKIKLKYSKKNKGIEPTTTQVIEDLLITYNKLN